MKVGNGIVFLLGVILRRGIVDQVIDDKTLMVTFEDLHGNENQAIVKLEPRWVAQQ